MAGCRWLGAAWICRGENARRTTSSLLLPLSVRLWGYAVEGPTVEDTENESDHYQLQLASHTRGLVCEAMSAGFQSRVHTGLFGGRNIHPLHCSTVRGVCGGNSSIGLQRAWIFSRPIARTGEETEMDQRGIGCRLRRGNLRGDFCR